MAQTSTKWHKTGEKGTNMKKHSKIKDNANKKSLIRFPANIENDVDEWVKAEALRLGVKPVLVVRVLLRQAKDSGKPVVIG